MTNTEKEITICGKKVEGYTDNITQEWIESTHKAGKNIIYRHLLKDDEVIMRGYVYEKNSN